MQLIVTTYCIHMFKNILHQYQIWGLFRVPTSLKSILIVGVTLYLLNTPNSVFTRSCFTGF